MSSKIPSGRPAQKSPEKLAAQSVQFVSPPTTLHKNLPLLEVVQPLLLDTLMSDPKMAMMIRRRISDRCALVAPEDLEAVIARLKKLGHLPKVIES